MKDRAVIVGYSGHAYVVIDTLLSNKFVITGYFERQKTKNNPYNLPYLGDENDKDIADFLKKNKVFICIGDNKIRAKIYNKFEAGGIQCPYVVDGFARVSSFSKIGNGSVVLPGAIINSCAEIGRAVICNSASVIEHECRIDDYGHIAPGAVLAGNVKVGKYTFIGANAVIKQGIIIGSDVIVGAGAVVTKNVDSGSIIYGNPAKSKKT
jgi:sugar O-acyltransferase (sialic acid O-acetyltransferase NeuD family)